ncbi:sensor domain-containing diguanylate cyclase [Oleiagrimonas sp. C23AA]|nr:sensor domain-containing diguanylate cyclase [Oleiagrimonas sp. C23AA]
MVPAMPATSASGQLLTSVADITRHRDFDALDHSLVLSLAQLTGASEVMLYRHDHLETDQPATVVRCAQDASGIFGIGVDHEEPSGEERATLQRCEHLQQTVVESQMPMARICTPLRQDAREFGVLCLRVTREHLGQARLLTEGFARIYANYMALLEDSERDKLTGLYNRRTFDRHLQRHLARQRNQEGLADAHTSWLVLLDIDHFKRINDTYGHVYGDEVILLLARTMRACFHAPDALFRFGGEEFVVLIENGTEQSVFEMLEVFRSRVAAMDFPQVGRVTVSLGFACIGTHDHPDIVLDRADKALYFAKNQGRNRTYAFESLVRQGELQPTSTGSIDLF